MSKEVVPVNKQKLRIQVSAVYESSIILRDELDNTYTWFTKSYTSPLFYAGKDEWFDVSATLFTYDEPTPKTGLKNVRILKR